MQKENPTHTIESYKSVELLDAENNQLILNDIESRRVFLFTLEWLLALMERYTSPLQFGLVHIEFGSHHELGEAVGVHEAFKQLASLTASLTNAFRKTDIVARDATDFWVIVPYTNDVENINEKILDIFETAKHHGLKVVDREISIFELPLNADKTSNIPSHALEFLAYLKEHRQQLARHSFRLSANVEG
jgi:hypothetical protein